MSLLNDCCFYLGAAVLFLSVAKLALWIKLNFLQSNSLKKYLKVGKWAVVTGASDGIGKAFSLELAKAGFNIALVSRTKSKLDDVAEQCAKYNVETKCIVFDFASASSLDYKKLGHEIDALEVGLLVNNVGINYSHPKFFEDVDISEDLSILKVNCESQLQMTKFVLPQLKKKKGGAIVSLSSYSIVAEAGLLSTYAGTKAFNKTFSEALCTEVSRFNIDVLAVTPNMVVSNMSKTKRETFMIVNARATARQTLNKLGSVSCTSGHWHHAIIEYITTLLPDSTRRNQTLSAMLSLKKKAERKAAQQK